MKLIRIAGALICSINCQIDMEFSTSTRNKSAIYDESSQLNELLGAMLIN